jgi:cyclic pyranopterin phosphate synthase
VALRGFNDQEVRDLCQWAWERDVVPRFIEWMPMSDGALYAPGQVMTAAEIRAAVGETLVPDEPPGRHHGPARYWRTPGGRLVGIISAMSEHFCDTCNRVRLTSVGELHTCLGYDDGTDLRKILRRGGTDGDLLGAIQAAVGAKRQGHQFTESGCGAPRKHMVSIGG